MKHLGGEKEETSIDPTPGRHEEVGSWYQWMTSYGVSVPIQAPWAISRVMRTFDVGPREAFNWLVERDLLMVFPGAIIVNLRSTTADLHTLSDTARPRAAS